MDREFTYLITKEFDSFTIEQYLKAKGFSRQNITLLKKMHESVLLNDAWSYCNQRVKFSDKLVIKIKEETGSANVVPVSLPLTIIYEDEDILVINKSSNMPIHPSIHNYENTLANAVAYYYECQSIPYTFRCINRLDRDTSGLTILAKHMVSANILGQFMKDRKIKREYLCIVDGKLEGNGTINAPIGRVDGSTIERKIDYPNGEHAITHYETLSSCSRLSFLNVWLDTGRTHQIRVHMKSIGHPLIGDFLYHPSCLLMERQALHSHRLTFPHPITNEIIRFEAALPNDMKALLLEYNCI